MFGIVDLRTAIKDTVDGRANTRAAGAGLWAWYVRATMQENTPKDAQEFTARHATVVAELEGVLAMSKQEKSSLASAKSIIKNAVEAGLDVWQRNDDGSIKTEELSDGRMVQMPRGKSDLQNDKTPFEKLMAALGAAETIVNKEDWLGAPSAAEREQVMLKVRTVLQACGIVV
jgi:hypothetical protein